ncbi:MAG TPA: PhoU domain-containing protein [Xanthobacteraceae bacterium]|jgi:hypothetical protein
MIEHIARAFDLDLQELVRKITEMSGLAEKQINDAVQALATRDIALAKQVIAADDKIDMGCLFPRNGRRLTSPVGKRCRYRPTDRAGCRREAAAIRNDLNSRA